MVALREGDDAIRLGFDIFRRVGTVYSQALWQEIE
jgi:hypothetical protein